MTRWVRAALLVLGLFILAGFVGSLDLAAIVSAVSEGDAGWLMLALALLVVNVMIKALRWRVMAATMGAHPLSLPAASAAILAGVAAASLTPGRGVELAEPARLRKHPGWPVAAL